MPKLRLKLPSLGTVLGFTALMVALAGNAGALPGKNVVKRGDIAKGAVTARNLSRNAVRRPAITKASVTPRALRGGAVGTNALAANAVTANAIAPDSVRGYALGPVVIHTTPIADNDASPDLSTWTSSNTEVAKCGVGERLLSGGVTFTDPGNRRVGIIESQPFSNSGVEGWAGQITSDSGGSASAEVEVVCLK